MNIVTKSGTNDYARQLRSRCSGTSRSTRRRSAEQIAEHREERLPALSVRRIVRRADRPEQGALLRRGRADAAGHATRRSTRCGLFPRPDGVYATPVRENAVTGKVHEQPESGAVPRRCATAATTTRSRMARRCATRPSRRGRTSENTFNSFNVNHNWVLGGIEAERVRRSSTRISGTTSRSAAATLADLPQRRARRARTRTRRRRPSRPSGSSATTSRGA